MNRKSAAIAVMKRLRALEGARAAREAWELSRLDVEPDPWDDVIAELGAWELPVERTCGTCRRGCRHEGRGQPCNLHRTAAEMRQDANDRLIASLL